MKSPWITAVALIAASSSARSLTACDPRACLREPDLPGTRPAVPLTGGMRGKPSGRNILHYAYSGLVQVVTLEVASYADGRRWGRGSLRAVRRRWLRARRRCHGGAR